MFGKIFASMFDGTLRGKPHDILVFVNMIAKATGDGIVDRHFRAIAEDIGLSVDEVRAATARLEQPDKESRTPDCDGARIVRLEEHREWGWSIVNYEKYRALRNEESRREYQRNLMRKRRTSQKLTTANTTSQKLTTANTTSQKLTVSNVSNCEPPLAKEEGEEEGDSLRAPITRARANEEKISPEPEDPNEFYRGAPKKIATPGDEARLVREFGCRFPTDADVDFFAQKSGIPEAFWKNWIREMENCVVLRADMPEKRMIDSGGLPVHNWRTFLNALWMRQNNAKGSRYKERSGGQPAPLERDFFAECREEVKHPDVVPDWDVEKELPECVWAMFKGCLQASLTDREVYRRHLRAAQSRGEDFSKQMETLRDECKREWRGSFEKRWAEFMSRGNPFEKK